MDSQDMQQIVELETQTQTQTQTKIQMLSEAVKTLSGELTAVREELDKKQDRLVLKKNGLSGETIKAIAEERLEREASDGSVAYELQNHESNDIPTAVREALIQELRPGGLLHRGGVSH